MRKIPFLLCLVLMLPILSSCGIIRIEEAERRPLEYTVINPREIPEELLPLIEGKKEKEFQMTYQNKEDFYLIKGYGRQMTGGYSIQVEELSLSENAVFFRTKLLGPSEDNPGNEPSYPYIVVKTRHREEPVQFL